MIYTYIYNYIWLYRYIISMIINSSDLKIDHQHLHWGHCEVAVTHPQRATTKGHFRKLLVPARGCTLSWANMKSWVIGTGIVMWFYGILVGFHGIFMSFEWIWWVLVGFHGTLWDFSVNLNQFNGFWLEFNGILTGLWWDLMGFYNRTSYDLMELGSSLNGDQ